MAPLASTVVVQPNNSQPSQLIVFLQLALKILYLATITSLFTDPIPKSRQDGAQGMTRHALAAALMLWLLGSLAGCGTMANLSRPDPNDADAPRPGRVFGGVVLDAAWARKHFETPASAEKKEPSLVLLCQLDASLSVAAASNLV